MSAHLKAKRKCEKGVSKTLDSRHLTGDAIDILPSAIKPGMEWHPHFFEPVLMAFKQAADEEGVTLRFGKNWKSDPVYPLKLAFLIILILRSHDEKERTAYYCGGCDGLATDI